MFTQTITDIYEEPLSLAQRVLNVFRRRLGWPVMARTLVIKSDVRYVPDEGSDGERCDE